MVDCARMAPSARNTHPLGFVVVTEKETMHRIGLVCANGSFIREAAACIIVCGDASNKHLVEDGCAATENILIAAKSLGIGSCWVAGWKRDYNTTLMDILEIPSEFEIVSIIPMGYPFGLATMPSKKKLPDVLHWEVF